MKELTNWLMEIEKRAAVMYEEAAKLLSADADLSALLKRLAVDEWMHLDTLKGATHILDELPDPGVPLIRLDEETKAGIASGFISCECRIKDKSLSKNAMLDCLVATEFSEWNGLFLYVVNALGRRDGAYTAVKPKMQQHKRLIERYCSSLPDADVYLKKIAQLPIAWREKLLVVDDYAMITDMLTALLEDEGAIDVARNGMEALEKLKTNYYAAVISDVDMPVMNGVRLFEEAVKIYPAVSERFLFFTGSMDDERTDFFSKNRIKYIVKPARVGDIRKAVARILSRQG
ncbi:MAG: response regulator [Deltaproteobacteria bacterium]|nr:response regulator [Deltaproteobacteria bacterium]